MSDEQSPREPVLKPKDEAKFKAVRRKAPVNPEDHDPVLMSEGYHHQKVKPPYFMIALVLCGVVLACWKIWMFGSIEEIDRQRKQAQIIAQDTAAKIRR
ncbi:MAG: hypothetical protein COB36_04065 [Alphaproteobacteria bacterium]|nr:MAG: hypothetical protein COB36_04065 [Alphaproteobacteria bacterium]